MKATDRMTKVVTEELGVPADGELNMTNLFLRQLAMGKVIDELEEKIESLERRLITIDNK